MGSRHRLIAADGLSLTVPASFTEAPERESAQLPLVAVVATDEDPGGFAPSISVRVDPVGPELASLTQLTQATIARQIAAEWHVVAVESLTLPGKADGRWVTSLSPRFGTTILELQYLTIRAGRAITLSVQVKASRIDPGLELFHSVVGTLECDGAGAEASTAPAELAPLGDFGPRQPFTSARPPLGPDDLTALKSVIGRRRRGHDGLINAGLIESDGRLTGAGMIARDLLLGAKARLTAGLTKAGGEGRRTFQVLATGSDVLVIADPPPGGPGSADGSGQTLDVVPSLTLAARLVRWLGVAPAPTFGIGEADALTVRVEARAWNARIADPDAPPPDDAPAGLIRLWAAPWQLATVRSTKKFRNGPRFMQFLKTPEAGYAAFAFDSVDGSVVVRALSSAELLYDLLVVSGAVSPAAGARQEASPAGPAPARSR